MNTRSVSVFGTPRWALMVGALMLLFGGIRVSAAELDADQAKLLAAAQTHLKQLQANLKLAQETAGPPDKPVSPSKARLAMARLDSAKQSVPQVQGRLEKLPADHADVQATRKQLDADVAAIAALEARLKGEPPAKAPAEEAGKSDGNAAPAAKPAPGNEGVKLNYKQEDLLKNARFHTRDAQGKAEAVAEVAAKVQAAENIVTLDHRLVQSAVNTIADARGKAKNADNALAELPADGRGVPEVAGALTQVKASLDESEKVIAPAHAQLMKLVDPANYPSFQADVKRLSELAGMYRDTSVLEQDRPRAIELIAQGAAAQAEHNRIVKAYAPLIIQKTSQGEQLAGTSRHFVEQITGFAQVTRQLRETLPPDIDQEIAGVNKMADEAVAEQKPAFFNGGIPQRMEWVKDKVALYAALEPEKAKPYQAKVVELAGQLKKKQAQLTDAIIANNTLPPDNYQGGDREALVKLATDAWLKVQPGAKVLASRIPSQNWKRENIWRYSSGGEWGQIDRSSLQVQLIVKHDDKLAVIRPVNLSKNHMQNDQINGYPMDGKDDALEPQRFLPLGKVK